MYAEDIAIEKERISRDVKSQCPSVNCNEDHASRTKISESNNSDKIAFLKYNGAICKKSITQVVRSWPLLLDDHTEAAFCDMFHFVTEKKNVWCSHTVGGIVCTELTPDGSALILSGSPQNSQEVVQRSAKHVLTAQFVSCGLLSAGAWRGTVKLTHFRNYWQPFNGQRNVFNNSENSERWQKFPKRGMAFNAFSRWKYTSIHFHYYVIVQRILQVWGTEDIKKPDCREVSL